MTILPKSLHGCLLCLKTPQYYTFSSCYSLEFIVSLVPLTKFTFPFLLSRYTMLYYIVYTFKACALRAITSIIISISENMSSQAIKLCMHVYAFRPGWLSAFKFWFVCFYMYVNYFKTFENKISTIYDQKWCLMKPDCSCA